MTYHDVRDPPPKLTRSDDVVGILSWFAETSPATRRYLGWLASPAAAGKRVLVIGELGGDFWAGDLPVINRVLASMGLSHAGKAVDVTTGTRVLRLSPALTAFEGPADPVVPRYSLITRTNASVVPWVRLLPPDREQATETTVVATGEGGGYAANGFAVFEEPGLGRARWLIDPFAFFGAALGRGEAPAPDVTTLSGRRIFLSHVDGDGLNNVVRFGAKYQILLLRVLYDTIVQRFPDLPLTLSLTTGDLDPFLGGNETPLTLLKDIWESENVEASVASHTRPYRWGAFERYDRSKEEVILETPLRADVSDIRKLFSPKQERRFVADLGTADRNYIRKPFDLQDEIVGAVEAASRIAGRPVRLFQWSGDALPFEGAITLSRRLGLRNMNGGESRYDGGYPSITSLLPIARPVGAERQIYAVAASEIPITTDWTPPNIAMARLDSTRAATELPRRLKAMNLHYHLSSLGEKAAFVAIQSSLRAAALLPLAPVSAGHYAEIADDFFNVAISRVAARRWRVGTRGSVQTVRFDQAAGIEVDLARSNGVLGQRHSGDALYVALDSAVEAAEIEIRASGGPQPIGLVESRFEVRRLDRHAHGWHFEASGFGEGDFRWSDVPAGIYDVCAEREAVQIWCTFQRSGPSRELTFAAPSLGTSAIRFGVSRRDALSDGVAVWGQP